jgi:hypothetical protein
MNENKATYNDGIPEMEDYSGTDGESRQDTTHFGQAGRYAGGTEGSKGTGEGERFGEFGNTGTGVDLTIEMESNEADPRSGLIKGGQPGEDGIAGLAQYGGEAGDLPIQGNIDGNE